MLREYIEFLVEEDLSHLYPHKKGDVVSVHPGDEIAKKIEPDVQDMVVKAYVPVGGHPTVTDKGGLGNYSTWMVSDIDNDPQADVVMLSKTKAGGEKQGAIATDGSPEAKAKLAQMLKQFFSQPHNWAEVSGAPAHILINKLGVPAISDRARVEKLLRGKDFTWNGEHPEGLFPGTFGWYTRIIGGEPHTKIIVGQV